MTPPQPPAERIIDFIQRYCLIAGDTPGARPRPFELAAWQLAFLRELYAPGAGGPRKSRALVTVAKKNGKTALAAALVLAYLAGPMSRPAGRYFSVAGGSKEQAGELFGALCDMITRHKALEARLEIDKRMIISHRTNLCSYRALATNERSAHGIIPDLWVYDELAQARDFAVYEALDRAGGTKHDSMGLVISTMSDQPHNPMAELVRAVTEGQSNGGWQEWCVRIYQADPDGDIYDLDNVRKANPSMGVFLSQESVQREIEEAQSMPGRRAGFIAYRLNLDAGVESPLIAPLDWAECAVDIDRNDLRGERCFGGLDLSASRDLTAFALYFPDHHALICSAWMPRETIGEREREDHAPYRAWARDGWIHLCEGPVIDREQVVRAMLDACALYDVQEVRYDAWRIRELEADARKHGWTLPTMTPFRQGYVSFGPAVDELERLVLSSTLQHEDNPVLNMCVRNTRAVVDARSTNAERRPEKVTPAARIDCAVAALMAVARGDAEVRERMANDLIMSELYS